MVEATIPPSVRTEKVGKWARIQKMFAEMDQILARVKQDQEETDRMRVEIRANLDRLDSMRAQAGAS